jgi:crotonobetainyl-CoA:carnitine CoA-transferase CaiB-like acyl-CoA transferase
MVYGFGAGYDQRGPNAAAPAYDDVIQAASGVAALNANERGEPRYLPTILCDKVAGLHLAIAVAAAIARRARTGEGCCIEAPMFESMVSFLMSEQLGGATFEPPLGPTGYDRLTAPNRKPYRTRDGYLAILPYTTTHWVAFFEAAQIASVAVALLGYATFPLFVLVLERRRATRPASGGDTAVATLPAAGRLVLAPTCS